MVVESLFRKHLEDIEETPPCLWVDTLRKMRSEKFTEMPMLAGAGSEVGIILGQPKLWGASRYFGEIESYGRRIEAVNKYFRIKAGQVFGNTRALGILSELSSKKVMPKDEWKSLNINQNAVALAMLAAAGFCNVDGHSISITDEGEQFISDLLE